MYKYLEQMIRAEHDKDFTEDAARIKNDDNILRSRSTDLRWSQYESGKITKEQLIEMAVIRAWKQRDKEKFAELQKLDSIEKAGKLIDATISIEWKRSQTWGNNPTAEMRISYTIDGRDEYRRIYGSSIGGCGYDKESTAAAQVVNQSYECLKLFANAKEKALRQDKEATNETALGYGAGYGVIPALHGGVGMDCFLRIFQKLGYKAEKTASGKTFDVYEIKKA